MADDEITKLKDQVTGLGKLAAERLQQLNDYRMVMAYKTERINELENEMKLIHVELDKLRRALL